MKQPELFWNATQNELQRGYRYCQKNRTYTCLICGETYRKDIIYQEEDLFINARRAVENHIQIKHQSMFDFLVQLNKKYTGLSDIQKTFIEKQYQGRTDQEIADEMDITISTVRNHRFKFREKTRQAKVQLAISNLLNQPMSDDYITPAPTSTMIDDRYQITEKERQKTLNTYFDATQNNHLKSFPAKEKKKIIVLREIVKLFKPGKKYTEKEVNRILNRIFDDHVSLRRYLIEYGMMARTKDCNHYWLAD